MRVLAVTLALLVIFVGFAIWMQIDLTRTLADTANQADQALRDVEQAAWASAREWAAAVQSTTGKVGATNWRWCWCTAGWTRSGP